MLFETFAIVCVYSPNSLLKHLKDNSKNADLVKNK